MRYSYALSSPRSPVKRCLRAFLPNFVTRRFASTASLSRAIDVPTASRIANRNYDFPIISECPPPSCPCGVMPAGLNIDHKKPLRGTMPHYTHHVVVLTGRDDWESRIESEIIEPEGTNLARELKKLVGPKGKLYDPRRNILVTNCSLNSRGTQGSDVLLFPQSRRVNNIGGPGQSLEAFVRRFLASTDNVRIELEHASNFAVERIESPTILICGHLTRDKRCGVLGPLLLDEFKSKIVIYRAASPKSEIANRGSQGAAAPNIGLISHIGGHAWAGNVIVYVPTDQRLESTQTSPLAGKGVWYGRVEPKHVEGIVKMTLQRGKVIEGLLRGVHG